jgi:periplasmic divalent cation tolerance protein
VTRAVVSMVWTTVPDDDVARRLARELVEARLVACVNILPAIRSIYRWQGKIDDTAEVLMVMKTAASRVPALITEVERRHPYDVPEVVAMEISTGSTPYLDWVVRETETTA